MAVAKELMETLDCAGPHRVPALTWGQLTQQTIAYPEPLLSDRYFQADAITFDRFLRTPNNYRISTSGEQSDTYIQYSQ